MPPSFCEMFPDDPNCVQNIPVDSGIVFIIFLAVGFGIMLLTKNLDGKKT
jgi:hypothetical protein